MDLYRLLVWVPGSTLVELGLKEAILILFSKLYFLLG